VRQLCHRKEAATRLKVTLYVTLGYVPTVKNNAS
jgi:hypothetical protein